MVSFQTGPALQRVVVPGAACHVLIDVKVAVSDYIEPGALLVADHDGHRVLKLLAETDVEHTSIQRAAPQAYIEPARARKRSGDRAGENQIRSSSEHRFLQAI